MRALVALLAVLLLGGCASAVAYRPDAASRPAVTTHASRTPAGTSGPNTIFGPGVHVLSAARVGAVDVWGMAVQPCTTHRRGCLVLYRSSDGGRSWRQLPSSPGSVLDRAQLSFADASHGWLLLRSSASGTTSSLYSTGDGGLHWVRVAGVRNVGGIALAASHVYVSAADAPARAIYAAPAAGGPFVRVGPSVGDDLAASAGTVYDYAGVPKLNHPTKLVTVDQNTVGISRLPCGRFSFQVALGASRDGELLAVCGSEPGAGNQLKTAYVSPDGGADWRHLTKPPEGGYIGDAAVTRAGLFYTGSRSPLSVSSDEGRTWHVAVAGSGSAGGMWQLAIADGVHGSVVDGGPPSALYLTDDSGASWHRARLP